MKKEDINKLTTKLILSFSIISVLSLCNAIFLLVFRKGFGIDIWFGNAIDGSRWFKFVTGDEAVLWGILFVIFAVLFLILSAVVFIKKRNLTKGILS